MENDSHTAAQTSFLNRKSYQLLSTLFVIGVLALTSCIVARTSNATAASLAPQLAITGEWTAEISKKSSDKIQFTLNRQTGTDHSNFGSDLSLAEFQGLTREQVTGAQTSVKFRLV